MSFYIFLFSGFISGLLGGMGMGGGTILIPLLTLVFGVPQKLSQGANLVSFLPMSALSLKIHTDNGYVKYKGILYIMIPAVLFSALGSLAAVRLPSEYLTKGFGTFLSILSVYEFVCAAKSLYKAKKK